jgi:hypothetical protein
VRSGQRKSGDAVVERRRRPAGWRVTGGAIRRAKRGAGRGVHGIVRLLPGGQMALRISAICRRDRQIVIVVDVAQIAGHVGVPARQREPGRAVVKRRGGPTDRSMAGRAIRRRKRSPGRGVDGIGGGLPGSQMAL